MDICFHTFALLFSLFAATSCAPGPRLQGACDDVRSSSLELHRIVKRLSVEARNGSRIISNLPTKLAWIEEKDKCDPETLKKKPEKCLSKILSLSKSYKSALENLSGFESCKVAEEVMEAINNLQENILDCVNLSVPTVVSSNEVQRWKARAMCIQTLERLFSFSILTARVFAAGDPAHHTAGLPQKCA